MIDRYRDVREHTEALAAPLSAEDQTVQSMPDVSPTKWHRAHTTWFFETFVLERFAPGYRVFDDTFGFLFNSYYEAVGPRYPRAQRGLISRPGAAEVAAFRQHVDREMTDFIGCGVPPAVASVIDLGLHHEQQHQELLLMDIKHVLATNPSRPAYRPPGPVPPAGPNGPARWLPHGGGVVEIGLDGEQFGFDNETPRHEVLLRPFELAERLVTGGNWLAFIDDGGYRRPELWMSEGWATVTAEGWSAPLYWEQRGGQWLTFTLHGMRPLEPEAPVAHVSWFEAEAYARWAQARLPLEAEWETIAPAPGIDPLPAHPHPAPPTATDPKQWYGQVWQWTASPYVPYPGFHPTAGAIGEYNGKFMVNQQVLRGSCCATPPRHARASYRNFFPPAARWAFSGLRLARDA